MQNHWNGQLKNYFREILKMLAKTITYQRPRIKTTISKAFDD